MKYWAVLISHDKGLNWGIRLSHVGTKAEAVKARRKLERLEPRGYSDVGDKATYRVVRMTSI